MAEAKGLMKELSSNILCISTYISFLMDGKVQNTSISLWMEVEQTISISTGSWINHVYVG